MFSRPMGVIVKSAEILQKSYADENFPIDVFQTGSGTSTNMNVNEVISNISKKKFKIKNGLAFLQIDTDRQNTL